MRRSVWIGIAVLGLAVSSCGVRSGLRIEQRGFGTDVTGEQVPMQPSPGACRELGRSAQTLGSVAMVSNGALDVLDFGSCRVRRIVTHGVVAPVRVSPDGRWIAYGEQAIVVPAGGGRGVRPLAPGIQSWTWAPGRDLLAAVTAVGGVVTATPTTGPRQLLGAGFGATGLVFGPTGRLVVSREVPASGGATAELWTLQPGSRHPNRIYRDPTPGASLQLLGLTADGRWILFWRNPIGSASISADGLPLEALPLAGGTVVQIAPLVLPDPDLVARCSRGIVFTVGGGRDAGLGKRLATASPPDWRATPITPQPLSFVSPTCSAKSAVIAAAAGPSRPARVFGEEGRSIFLLAPPSATLRELTDSPPAGISDELPRFSPDESFVLFIRSGPAGANGQSPGELYLAPTAGRFTTLPLGPFAQLGPTPDYYGHYDWSGALDWRQR
jgi:hypothetical protein